MSINERTSISEDELDKMLASLDSGDDIVTSTSTSTAALIERLRDRKNLIERLTVEKEISDTEARNEKERGALNAGTWLKTAPYEYIKALGNLPRRHIDVFGRSNSWTNDDLAHLLRMKHPLPSNDYLAGFVGRVKSVWNEISASL